MSQQSFPGKKRALCRYFASTGTCFYGDGCQFTHAFDTSTTGVFTPQTANDIVKSTETLKAFQGNLIPLVCVFNSIIKLFLHKTLVSYSLFNSHPDSAFKRRFCSLQLLRQLYLNYFETSFTTCFLGQ